MKTWQCGVHLFFLGTLAFTPVVASPQIMDALAQRLGVLSQGPLSGSLYIDSKFAYRFYVSRTSGSLEVALRGEVFADYTYHPKSQKLVVKWPGQPTGLVLGPSSNLKSIEWMIKSVYLGALAETDASYQVQRKLGPRLDIFEIELTQGAVTKIEVSILIGSRTPSLLSVRALDPQKQEYLFLFD